MGGRATSSPHTRRYFLIDESLRANREVFSAHAEVFPRTITSNYFAERLLRTRGGISMSSHAIRSGWGSSPHTRRYFARRLVGPHMNGVFSAHAEVFPSSRIRRVSIVRLLRTRGGISLKHHPRVLFAESSPHTRRYFQLRLRGFSPHFVFSAHAEVFLKRGRCA